MTHLRPLALMAASSLGFAFMTVIVKLLSADLSAFWLVVIRTGFTSLVFMLALMAQGQKFIPKTGTAVLVIRGLAGFGGISCLFYGATHLPLAIATLLNWSAIVFVLMFSALFLNERVEKSSLLWIGLAALGLMLLISPNLNKSSSEAGSQLSLLAVAIGVLGAIFSAMATTAVRAASFRFSAELIIFYFSALAFILALPLAFLEARPGHVVSVIFSSPLQLGLVLALGAFGTLAQYAMTRGYALVSAGIGSSMGLLTAAFSALLGWWFFDERLSGLQWIGVFTLSVAVFLIGFQRGPRRSRKGRALAQTSEIS
ncbi:MAG: DMT family transporter [Bdellovibrionales bacterium]|nr:DMT family transporter [Bdellovibrionales bacterium]